MRKSLIVLFICLIGGTLFSLTPQERQFAIRAREYLAAAKEKVERQQELLRQSDAEVGRLDTMAQGQQKQIVDLSGQIDKAHNNEQTLAKYNAYAKPIIDQVNSHWGLGAFVYGFKVLGRHLLILLIVVIVLSVIVIILSIVFPGVYQAVSAFLSMAGTFLSAVFNKIKNLFKKK